MFALQLGFITGVACIILFGVGIALHRRMLEQYKEQKLALVRQMKQYEFQMSQQEAEIEAQSAELVRLAQQVATLHGGTLEAAGNVERPGEVGVRLPRRPRAVADRSHPRRATPLRGTLESGDGYRLPNVAALSVTPSHPATLLVAHADAGTREDMRRHLSADYEVLTAADGAEALIHLRAARPALVAVGTADGAADGGTLLAAIRADRALQRIPLLLLVSPQNPAERSFEADASLAVPCGREEVLAQVRRLLNG